MSASFKPGDLVTVVSGGDVEALGVVKTVGKLKITLMDGSAWRASDGRRWGDEGGQFFPPHLRERRESDEDACRRRKAIAAYHRIKPADLPLETLEQIVKLAGAEGA